MEWDYTSWDAFVGMVMGAVFGNCFPFPGHWWARIQTPVGVVLAGCVGWFCYAGV